MNREIKFRAWDKKEKLMIEGITLSDKTDAVLDTFEIMQFTGLLDKNGKEIYEGDILLNKTYEREQKVEVFWKGCIKNDDSVNGKEWIDWGGWSFRKLSIEEEMTLSIDNDKIEIICNIFENKKLLESKRS